MQQSNYNSINELDEDLNIDFKKIFMIFWSHKELIIKVFLCVLVIFILLTFIMPKKYVVSADIYIHKSNNTNLMEINPYVIEELGALGGGMASLMSGGSGALTNELEIMQSSLIMDKVVRDNDMKYRKKWGIIPNKREGEYIPGYAISKSKSLSIENKKGTNVVSIEFKSRNPQVAYNIVCSIITNYIEVSKQLHSEKAKNDTKILEEEYHKVRASLIEKIADVSAIPPTTIGGGVNINALGAFSKSARQALSSVTNQYKIGTKSNIDVQEESTKMSELATKLQWAKMVEEMSESSKVLVLKEPRLPKDTENSSPKLMINIILGIIFGIIAAFWAVVFSELSNKKVSYSKLGENIIYKDEKTLFNIQKFLVNYKDQNITCIIFDNPEPNIAHLLSESKNLNIIKASISPDLIDTIKKNDSAILLLGIGKTDLEIYKSVKETLIIHNKQILKEILI